MAREPHDPWRMPSLDRLGEELRGLETPDTSAHRHSSPGQLVPALGLAAALIVALVVLLVLDQGQPARALSAINRAPAAAARSRSVAFHSSTTIAADGHQLRRFTQQGVLDFATDEYRTTLMVVGSGVSIEQRSVDGILYVGEKLSLGPRAGIRWLAVRESKAQRAELARAPATQAFTEPLNLLVLLANARSPVTVVGREALNGAATTRYRLVTDLGSVIKAESSGSPAPTRFRDVRASLDVWLDQADRPLRIAEDFAGSSPLGPATMRTVLTFVDYGRGVAVEAPAHVRPAPALQGSLPNSLTTNPSRLFEQTLFGSP